MNAVLVIAIVLIVFGVAMQLIDRHLNRPLTDTDRYCSSVDQELDELEAQRRTRPHGNCDVIPFPDIPRHRGGRGPWQLRDCDDPNGDVA